MKPISTDRILRQKAPEPDDEFTTTSVVIKRSGAVPKSAEKKNSSRQIQRGPFQDMTEIVIAPPMNLDQLLKLTEENAVHSSCIGAKVTDAVGQGWRLVRKKKQEVITKEMETQRDEFIDKIAELCPAFTFSEMLEQAGREYDGLGWGIWEVVRDTLPEEQVSSTGHGVQKGKLKKLSKRAKLILKLVTEQLGAESVDSTLGPLSSDMGEVIALFPIPGHTVRATKKIGLYVQVRGESKRWFKAFGDPRKIDASTGKEITDEDISSETKPVLASELFIFKTYNPRSNVYGVPKWISGIPSCAEQRAIREFNVSWYESGGQADRIVHVVAKVATTAKALSDDIVRQIKKEKGRGHMTLNTHGTEDVKITVEELSKQEGKREGQFGKRREDLIKELMMAHQVPPYRIGWADMGSLGGTAAKEMLRSYRLGVIEPFQTVFEDRMNNEFFSELGIPLPKGWKWELVDLDWDQLELNITMVSQAVDKAMLCPNEGREALGYMRSTEEYMNHFFMHGKDLTDPTLTQDTLTQSNQPGEAQDGGGKRSGAKGSAGKGVRQPNVRQGNIPSRRTGDRRLKKPLKPNS